MILAAGLVGRRRPVLRPDVLAAGGGGSLERSSMSDQFLPEPRGRLRHDRRNTGRPDSHRRWPGHPTGHSSIVLFVGQSGRASGSNSRARAGQSGARPLPGTEGGTGPFFSRRPVGGFWAELGARSVAQGPAVRGPSPSRHPGDAAPAVGAMTGEPTDWLGSVTDPDGGLWQASPDGETAGD